MAKQFHHFKFLLDSSSPGICSPVQSSLPSQADGEISLQMPAAWEEPGPGQCVGRLSQSPM